MCELYHAYIFTASKFGDPTDWLSEAGRNHQWVKESIEDLKEILNGSPTIGP